MAAEQQSQESKNRMYLICLLRLMVSIIAAYLCWKCNAKEGIFIKMLVSFIALMFSEIYILYYVIYRVFMGNKCYA